MFSAVTACTLIGQHLNQCAPVAQHAAVRTAAHVCSAAGAAVPQSITMPPAACIDFPPELCCNHHATTTKYAALSDTWRAQPETVTPIYAAFHVPKSTAKSALALGPHMTHRACAGGQTQAAQVRSVVMPHTVLPHSCSLCSTQQGEDGKDGVDGQPGTKGGDGPKVRAPASASLSHAPLFRVRTVFCRHKLPGMPPHAFISIQFSIISSTQCA